MAFTDGGPAHFLLMMQVNAHLMVKSLPPQLRKLLMARDGSFRTRSERVAATAAIALSEGTPPAPPSVWPGQGSSRWCPDKGRFGKSAKVWQRAEDPLQDLRLCIHCKAAGSI